MKRFLFAFGDETALRVIHVFLADLNGDAHQDAFLEDAPNQVFATRDGNSDGLPEGFIVGCCGGGSMMMNYGTLFSNQRSCLGIEPPTVAALGDLNGDGFLDAAVGNRTDGRIWFNDGQGNFTA